MTEKADRAFEIITNSHTRTHQEFFQLKEVGYLSLVQQSLVKSLIQDLVCAEVFVKGPVLSEGPNPCLLKAINGLVEAVKKDVPRVVILAVLDREFLKAPASGAVGYSGG